jgi:tetratricopeptide (TPR) repeat protein
VHMGMRRHNFDPIGQDVTEERDVRHQQCNSGNRDACFAIEFGNCADANPRVAIPACSWQIAEQDTRRIGGDIRFERAIRYFLRANAYSRLGDLDNALSDYDLAVTTDASVFWMHAQRGDAYFLAGNFAEALVSYDAALALNSDLASVLNNRALVYAAAPDDEIRNATQALADAHRANEISPGQPAYIDALAVAYAANGDFENAVAEAERAIEILPPGNQAILDDYIARLALYRNGQTFRIAPTAGS